MNFILSLIIYAGLTTSFPVLAKKGISKDHYEKLDLTPPGPMMDLDYYPWMSEESFKEQKKSAQEQNNKNPSRTVSNTDALPQDYDNFIKRWVGLKTTEELDKALVDLEAAIQKPGVSLSLRFVGNQLVPFRSFRSFVYKMVHLAELAEPRAVHSVLLSFVQQSNQFLKIYMPEHRWQLIFDYVTEPYSKDEKQFQTVHEMQSYLLDRKTSEGAPKSIMTALQNTALGLKKLESEMKSGRVVWDNRILYGSNTFKDNVERFRVLRAVDYHAALAAVHANIAGINFFTAYAFHNYFHLLGELGQLYGLDGFSVINSAAKLAGFTGLHPDVQGAPAWDRHQVLVQDKFKKTFELYSEKSFGQNQMAAAFKSIKESAHETALVWEELKGRPTDQEGSFLVDSINPYSRAAGLSISKMLELVDGTALLTSPVTGDSVQVNLGAFFNEAPKNLLSLLPKDFKDKNLFRKPKKFSDGSSISYRNYDRGRPVSWSNSAYSNLFPELKNKSASGKEVGDYARVLAQTWGGGLVGLPLALFVQ